MSVTQTNFKLKNTRKICRGSREGILPTGAASATILMSSQEIKLHVYCEQPGHSMAFLAHMVWFQAFDLCPLKGLYFAAFPEHSAVLMAIDSKGPSHQTYTDS